MRLIGRKISSPDLAKGNLEPFRTEEVEPGTNTRQNLKPEKEVAGVRLIGRKVSSPDLSEILGENQPCIQVAKGNLDPRTFRT